MLTPVNVQISAQGAPGAPSRPSRGSEGDNGFGALLSDTRARRQSDTPASPADADTRPSAVSRQQAQSDDAGANDQRSSLPADSSGATTAEARRPLLPGHARQTLSSALEQLQGNRLENRDKREGSSPARATDLTRGTDRAATALANKEAAEGTRQARLASLANGRQSLERLGTERADSKLSGMDRAVASRVDGRTEPADNKGKRLADSESKDDTNPLYALVDTGFLMQGSPTQKAPAGREGAQPARGAMLGQGLRGRDATALDNASQTLKGGSQEAARSERLFGEILSQREGPLSQMVGSDTETAFNTRAMTPTVNDNPLNTLSALTGQTGTSPMAPGTAQAVATATLPAMDSDQWSSAFERQVINLSMRGGGEARLNMNPLELGPLSISLKMGEQSAQLHIASHHAQVRAAIEAALPQLRDAFSASGIELGQTSVSDQGSFQQGGFQQQQERTPGALAGHDTSGAVPGINGDTDGDIISISSPIGRSLNGGIDLFA